MSDSNNSSNNAFKKCGLTQVLIFIAAIICGTGCSICSKTMMGLSGEGLSGTTEPFSKPIFQTLGMFVGMMFGLVMHGIVLWKKIPFPGYDVYHNHDSNEQEEKEKGPIMVQETTGLLNNNNNNKKEQMTIPIWMYFFLVIPSIFDLGATALCMMGLRYLDVSIYQMLRGSGIIFVALMKQHVLRHPLYNFQWIGVGYNVISVILVGATALLNSSDESHPNVESGEALLGVLLVMTGAFVQALQFVFEEKVMTMDIPSPPLLLIGMEGLWGTVLCLALVYPMAYYLPGDDHGSYEDPFNTWYMFVHSSTIQWSFVIYFVLIFGYNLFSVLVTFMLNSVWHAILDNFRPITVWATDVVIFYCITAGAFGEPITQYSWVQLLGMFVLLYGTAVYNAPNAGSILLEGKWVTLWMDCSPEYKEIKEEEKEAAMAAEWEERQASFKDRRGSSFIGERSPHISIHTQALRGLGTTHV
jgi:hypothetical protein